MKELKNIVKALKKAKKVAIFTHTNPDGDALGSAFALKSVLEARGAAATVFLECPLAEKFSFLNDGYALSGAADEFDTAVCVDCGAPDRLGKLKDFFMEFPNTIVIDHHISNGPFGTLYITRPESAACCELIFELSCALVKNLPQKAVVALYTGLSTDTGHFKYSNVTKKTHDIAGKLLGYGFDHRAITRRLYDTIKPEKMKFIGSAIAKTEFFYDGKIAVLECPDSFLEEFSLAHEDIEELPNTILSLEGVLVSVIIKEKEEKHKISLRCREVIDLSRLSAEFGGGGHKCAAGFVTELSMDALKEELVNATIRHLEEANG